MVLISGFGIPRLKLRVSRRRQNRLSLMILLLLVGLTILVPFYLIYKPPHLLVRYFQHRWSEVLFHVPTKEKVVALTIDDAPSQYTQEILQVLSEFNATATFFVIGSQASDAAAAEILNEIVVQGSELGNHAMSDEPSRSLEPDVLYRQISSVDVMIQKAYTTAQKVRENRWFRPGSGFFSKAMLQVVEALDYHMVLGGVYPHDPQVPYPKINAKHILSMVRPGAIIICHDRRSWTVPMLHRVLPELRDRGYKVTTVSVLKAAGS